EKVHSRQLSAARTTRLDLDPHFLEARHFDAEIQDVLEGNGNDKRVVSRASVETAACSAFQLTFGKELHGVVARAATDLVSPGARVQQVIAIATAKKVVSVPPVEFVVPAKAKNLVIPIAA